MQNEIYVLTFCVYLEGQLLKGTLHETFNNFCSIITLP